MPNWVYNGLTIEGNPEQVTALVEQMNKPFVMKHENWNSDTMAMEVKQYKYPNPVFAFYNIIAPTDLEAYIKQPKQSSLKNDDPNWWADTCEIAKTDNSWYNWNMRNWGVKWDVALSEDTWKDTYMEGPTPNGENLVVYYNFDTAWGAPFAAIEKLSEQYPALLFTLSYEEEQGWGGEAEFLRGTVISQSEYESKCKDCDAEDQMEYCDNDCGSICGNCNWLGEADLEAVAECDEHKVYLDTKVPTYRKVEA